MATHDFARFYSRLEINGQLELITPLRIGAGRADDLTIADNPVVKDATGRPIIPGSSFKGVLRSYTESILRSIDEKHACLCVTTQSDHSCPTTKSRTKSNGQEKSDLESLQAGFADEDALYLDGTCWTCRVFGSGGMASKVTIPDLTAGEQWPGRYDIRHGVSIDRDTETAAKGRLYTSEAVPAGAVFAARIVVENGSEAEQGLVLLGLKAFERELVTLGGGGSRGLGRVKFTISRCQEVGDDPGQLIDYLLSGEGTDLDEAGRASKIQRLRQELGV